MPRHIAIIGNGITGITAARFLRKRGDDRITVISAETDFFFSRTALMYIYMGHMTYEQTKPYEDWFWAKNRIDLRRGYVVRVDAADKTLHFADQSAMSYDVLLLAVGSTFRQANWPGQHLEGVQGLYSYQDLERMAVNTQDAERAVVVGGGLIGVEMAEMLHSRGIDVTFLVREPSYMNRVLPAEESAMVNRHIRAHGIDLRLSTELAEVVGGEAGKVRAVRTAEGEEIPCQFVGLTIGVQPNITFLEGSGIETDRGILVNDRFETNVSDVYAGGDCAQHRNPPPGRRPVEQLWYTGRIQGKVIAENIMGADMAYDPGPFFNSAKFFDIEYQTYGDIKPELPEHERTLYWEDEAGDKSIRITYDENKHRVVGFNLMGIRYRHDVCEAWLRERRDIRYVLQHLGAANFDPEFFKQYETALIEHYNKQHPDSQLDLKRRRGLWRAFAIS